MFYNVNILNIRGKPPNENSSNDEPMLYCTENWKNNDREHNIFKHIDLLKIRPWIKNDREKEKEMHQWIALKKMFPI